MHRLGDPGMASLCRPRDRKNSFASPTNGTQTEVLQRVYLRRGNGSADKKSAWPQFIPFGKSRATSGDCLIQKRLVCNDDPIKIVGWGPTSARPHHRGQECPFRFLKAFSRVRAHERQSPSRERVMENDKQQAQAQFGSSSQRTLTVSTLHRTMGRGASQSETVSLLWPRS